MEDSGRIQHHGRSRWVIEVSPQCRRRKEGRVIAAEGEKNVEPTCWRLFVHVFWRLAIDKNVQDCEDTAPSLKIGKVVRLRESHVGNPIGETFACQAEELGMQNVE